MLKKGSQILLVLSILIFFSSTGLAQELEFSGELSQLLRYGLEEEEITTALTHYQLELEKNFGFTGKLYLSLAGDYDFQEEKGSIELDEAYVASYLENTDLTIGRQVINWGTADGINPTNSINPLALDSLTEGKLKGEPLLALQAIYYGADYDLTGVLIPRFVPVDTADYGFLGENEELDSIWDILESVPEPTSKLENMEFAFKYGTLLEGYDLHLSYFHGWEDIPALITKVEIDPLTLKPVQSYRGVYRKVDKLGIATAGVFKDLGVWAEAAYIIPEELNLTSNSPLETIIPLSMNEPYLQAVIGGDYTFANGVYSELQYLYYGNGSLISPYNLNPAAEVEAAHYLMNRLSYEVDQDNLLELTAITNLRDDSVLIVPAYTYSLTQVTDLKVAPLLTIGREGEFADFPRQISISVNTSF